MNYIYDGWIAGSLLIFKLSFIETKSAKQRRNRDAFQIHSKALVPVISLNSKLKANKPTKLNVQLTFICSQKIENQFLGALHRKLWALEIIQSNIKKHWETFKQSHKRAVIVKCGMASQSFEFPFEIRFSAFNYFQHERFHNFLQQALQRQNKLSFSQFLFSRILKFPVADICKIFTYIYLNFSLSLKYLNLFPH